MASEANYIFSDTEKAEKGYVKGAVTDMVTDALVVKPLSTMSIVDLLNKSNIHEVGGELEEKVVDSTMRDASGQGVRTHPPMVLLAMVRERNINQLAFYQVSVGALSPYERLSETMVMGCGPCLFVVIACKTRFTLFGHPDDHIRVTHADYPDVLWSGCIMKVVRISMLCQRRLLFLG
ncbi:hypothetical protein CK203_111152 [Vitis vinifera]|uniref:Uncharacterized protein n=1 Tax=Vitis vinifera TaxID=29760 RepID=A0A438EP61_VITVI|nr:hypothetical protein CK203_111152 [Vitis vinifera]